MEQNRFIISAIILHSTTATHLVKLVEPSAVRRTCFCNTCKSSRRPPRYLIFLCQTELYGVTWNECVRERCQLEYKGFIIALECCFGRGNQWSKCRKDDYAESPRTLQYCQQQGLPFCFLVVDFCLLSRSYWLLLLHCKEALRCMQVFKNRFPPHPPFTLRAHEHTPHLVQHLAVVDLPSPHLLMHAWVGAAL